MADPAAPDEVSPPAGRPNGCRLRDARTPVDLAEPRALLGLDDPGVERRLAAAGRTGGEALRAAARAAVGDAFGAAGPVALTAGSGAALALAATAARAHTGRPDVLALAHGRGRSDQGAVLAALAAAPARCAAVVIEPFGEAWQPVIAAVHAAGGLVIADETRSAFRLAKGPAPAAAGADLICVGEALAGGLPFGAVVARHSELQLGTPDAPPDATLAAAAATLAELADRDLHRELAALGERLAAAVAELGRREALAVELVGPPSCPAVRFAGQENASPELMLHHFGLELEAAGVRGGDRLLFHAGVLGDAFDPVVAAFDRACARLRTLLVEHNSYLSGGLDYAFATGDGVLRERGLAQYRFPATADVAVETVPGGVRIAFAPEVSALTSSGFYVPTRLRGDFELSIDYEVGRWRPGPDCACLALFVQNELSTARYYAQRMSAGSAPDAHSVLAVLRGVESGRRTVAAPRGGLRLTRQGGVLRAWHRTDDRAEWELLGEDREASTDDVIVGAKVWSLVRCDGLEVWFADLRVTATIPGDQIPLLEPRPDPRLSAR